MFPPIKRNKNGGEKRLATDRNCSNETAES